MSSGGNDFHGYSSGHGNQYRSDLIWSATVNLANSIVGVSLLSMPYALKRAGLLLGLLCIFSCAYFTYISCRFLAKASCATRRKSFQYLVLFTNGVLGKTVVELSVIGLNIGACVAFFVVIGDVAAEFLARYVSADELAFYKNSVMVLLATVIVLPLALVSDIGKFANLSAFSLLFYVIFALYVFMAFMLSPGPSDSALKSSEYPVVWYNLDGILEVAPIIAGSFTCQPALFPLMDTLEDDTPKSIEIVTKRAMIFVAMLYSSVGLFGYLMFGDSSLGDMLHNFERSPTTDFFKLSFAFSILFSFPLVVYPVRSSLETLLFQNLSQSPHSRKTKVLVSNHQFENEVETTSSDEFVTTPSRLQTKKTSGGEDVHIPSSRFMKMTFFIVAFTLTTGILIPHVEKILAFTGSTAGMLISMILPSIIYMRSLPKSAPRKAKVLLVFGVILMLVGTLNVLSTSSSDSVTQILYEKSLRRPGMFKIDDAIKEDYLKQKKLIEEEIAAREQELAKDEQDLLKRKEELVKQKEQLIGAPQQVNQGAVANQEEGMGGHVEGEPKGAEKKEIREEVVDEKEGVLKHELEVKDDKSIQVEENLEEPPKAKVEDQSEDNKMNVQVVNPHKDIPGVAKPEVIDKLVPVQDVPRESPIESVDEQKEKHEEIAKPVEDSVVKTEGEKNPVDKEQAALGDNAPKANAGDLPAKTGAEDGLLKQLKETQELQEKLMEHQNELINKLEGEHEPHEQVGQIQGQGQVDKDQNIEDPNEKKKSDQNVVQPAEVKGIVIADEKKPVVDDSKLHVGKNQKVGKKNHKKETKESHVLNNKIAKPFNDQEKIVNHLPVKVEDSNIVQHQNPGAKPADLLDQHLLPVDNQKDPVNIRDDDLLKRRNIEDNLGNIKMEANFAASKLRR